MVIRVNPCAAETVYKRLQAGFRSIEISAHLIKYLVADAKIIKYFNMRNIPFFIRIYFFRHLELEIASAISALNDEKYNQTIHQPKG